MVNYISIFVFSMDQMTRFIFKGMSHNNKHTNNDHPELCRAFCCLLTFLLFLSPPATVYANSLWAHGVLDVTKIKALQKNHSRSDEDSVWTLSLQ